MLGFLKIAGRMGAIIALVMLVVTLLKQLVALFGTLLFLIKLGIFLGFASLVAMVVLAMLRARRDRRREMDEL